MSISGPFLGRISRKFSLLHANGQLRWTRILVLYCISHGFLVASWNALYWDDWMVYAAGSEGVKSFFAECTRCLLPGRATIEATLIAPGPWLMRALTFLYFPLIAILLAAFLQRTCWLRIRETSYITLAVLFMPAYGARISHIDYQYSFSLLLFVLGAWMTLSPRVPIRVFALLPIFWSMFTASLQVFVAVIIVVLGAKLVRRELQSSVDRLVILGALCVFPIVHRYLFPVLFPSHTVTDGYNTIQVAFLLRAVVFTSLLLTPLMILGFKLQREKAVSRVFVLLSIGFALLGAGTFPYLAVGHFANLSDWILPFLPDESDWNSRHQLLQPFGIALIILAAAKMLRKRKRAFLFAIISISVVLNIAIYSGYYLDWMKQREFIAQMSESRELLIEAESIVLVDEALRFNARGRGVRSYEWTAMVNRATDLSIVVDGNSIQFCEENSPSHLVTVSADQGRLRSLISGRIGISIAVVELSLCEQASKTQD